MQIEYPFSNYNLFVYVYVLSFYDIAKKDKRFLDALKTLESKLVKGKIVVERVNRRFAKLSFCKNGEVSELGSRHYHKILENIG